MTMTMTIMMMMMMMMMMIILYDVTFRSDNPVIHVFSSRNPGTDRQQMPANPHGLRVDDVIHGENPPVPGEAVDTFGSPPTQDSSHHRGLIITFFVRDPELNVKKCHCYCVDIQSLYVLELLA